MDKDLYSITFSQDEWDRVIQSLRNEAYYLTQERNRAFEKGAEEYGTLLREEIETLKDIAETIVLRLPE